MSIINSAAAFRAVRWTVFRHFWRYHGSRDMHALFVLVGVSDVLRAFVSSSLGYRIVPIS